MDLTLLDELVVQIYFGERYNTLLFVFDFVTYVEMFVKRFYSRKHAYIPMTFLPFGVVCVEFEWHLWMGLNKKLDYLRAWSALVWGKLLLL